MMGNKRAAKPKNVLLPVAVARRLRRLLSTRPLRDLRSAARRHRTQAWIVGGAPRDLWMGRRLFDLDVAVGGDALPLARELARRGAGTLVPLSAEPPRVYRLAGKAMELDLAEVERGSIAADLSRRDFTVNAIALPVSGGPPLDPFDGLRDLSARRLRAVAAANFADDPLRALRAARLMATHGLVPDGGTLAICRRAGRGLAGTAPERIRAELVKLLQTERAGPALAWAASAGLLSPAFGRAVPAPVRRRFLRRRVAFDDGAVRSLAPDDRKTVRLAQIAGALRLSPSETARWLASRRFSRSEAGTAARVLELARDAGGAGAAREAWHWIRRAGALAPQALALLSASGPVPRRLAAGLRRRLASARRRPRFTGSDVLAWTGIAPGPRVGKLLEELEVAVLSGRIRTRREGRKWLRALPPAIIRPS